MSSRHSVLRLASLAFFFTFALPFAHAGVKWITPTGDELTMTADPKAPGAPAVFLSYEEMQDIDGRLTVHARIKVLSAGGFAASDVEIPYTISSWNSSSETIKGRTIHPDGTIIPFDGKPMEKTIEGRGDDRRIQKFITLPAVTIGSILEYDYVVENATLVPTWFIQQKYFAHNVHFVYKTSGVVSFDAFRWVANLPAGVEVKRVKNVVEVVAADLPAYPTDDYLPPLDQVRYNVNFFYWNDKPDNFWGTHGSDLADLWKNFLTPKKHISADVPPLLAGLTTDDQKFRKLYDVIMQMENTDFTRERSTKENKKAGLKEAKNADDIWMRKRGDSGDLTLLFIALSRAAGLQVYPMAISSRDHTIFNRALLDFGQLNTVIAVAKIDGKDVYFDPGDRYCPYGHLAPRHAGVAGMDIEEKTVRFGRTPVEPYTSAEIQRVANIKLDADAKAEGTINIKWVGTSGIGLRHQFLTEDKASVMASLEKSEQASVPSGIQIKITDLKGLEDYEKPLVADFTFSGTLGATTSSRILVPAQFFQSRNEVKFAPQTRTFPVVLPQSLYNQDISHITLPPGYSAEASTAPVAFNFEKALAYETRIQPTPTVVHTQRRFAIGRLDYPTTMYAGLRKFYSDVATQDEEQIVLRKTPAK